MAVAKKATPTKKPKAAPRTTKPAAAEQPDVLRLEYVPLDTARRWERNPKKHDEGAIWNAFVKHGFKDPPKYEPKLNGGKGGIAEGNGRTHVLRQMQAAGNKPPRGVVANADGVWLVPILFGVDAESEKAAEAYGVDHNNLALLGGDFGPIDLGRLWNQRAYTELLTELAQQDVLPVSVDGDDIDALIESYHNGETPAGDGASAGSGVKDGGTGSSMVPGDNRYQEQFGVIVICESEDEQRETFEGLQAEGYTCKVVTT